MRLQIQVPIFKLGARPSLNQLRHWARSQSGRPDNDGSYDIVASDPDRACHRELELEPGPFGPGTHVSSPRLTRSRMITGWPMRMGFYRTIGILVIYLYETELLVPWRSWHHVTHLGSRRFKFGSPLVSRQAAALRAQACGPGPPVQASGPQSGLVMCGWVAVPSY